MRVGVLVNMENQGREYKYQADYNKDGVMLHVRCDDFEEYKEACENIGIPWSVEKPVKSHPDAPQDNPEPWEDDVDKSLSEKYQGKTLDEIEEDLDPSWCEVHKVKMKEREGKYGTFYSHSQGNHPDLQWCSGSGFKEKK